MQLLRRLQEGNVHCDCFTLPLPLSKAETLRPGVLFQEVIPENQRGGWDRQTGREEINTKVCYWASHYSEKLVISLLLLESHVERTPALPTHWGGRRRQLFSLDPIV